MLFTDVRAGVVVCVVIKEFPHLSILSIYTFHRAGNNVWNTRNPLFYFPTRFGTPSVTRPKRTLGSIEVAVKRETEANTGTILRIR